MKTRTSKSNYRCVSYPAFAWRYMNPGVERRLAIIDHILQMDGMNVNRKYMPQTKQDPDLKKMLKDGTLVQTRETNWSTRSMITVLKLGRNYV